ncbi:hypothetical protein BBFGKLBO_00654 [Synechococcus sp. CBW1107]|nr:hypothetical protein BBFGKLBO_00654 [Synechococcus sp. CBW1107]
MHLERHGDLIRIQLIGTVEASVYDRIEPDLGALWRHLALVRDHHRAVRRVAVVGDKAWQALAETWIRQ